MSKTISSERLELFIPLLAEAVSRPDEAHPTVRVWKDTNLVGVINSIAGANRDALKTTFPPGSAVLLQLERLAWLHPISITDDKLGRSFFLMEQKAMSEVIIDPLEIIQAVHPSGVISYFAAVEFHELTTQPATFFHIALVTDGLPPEVSGSKTPSDRNPLGTELFGFQGSRCYETKRYRGLTPGVQLRVIGPRTWYRVTTLEQTLLDTLLQPVRCGGEAVVFEAWEHASERADFDRMAEYLQAIGRDSLIRRVAVMLELKGVTLEDSSALGELLRAVRERVSRETDLIPLLPGLEYRRLADKWRVLIP